MIEENKDLKKDSPRSPTPTAKGTVKQFFLKFEVKPYLLDAFCLKHSLKPESELSEFDFTKKLKELKEHKLQ
jgi:hypothetical protein